MSARSASISAARPFSTMSAGCCCASATRLYQNPARVHFNRQTAAADRFGRRIVYGGHVISLARALSFNGLANAFRIAAINGGRHPAPVVAGDTGYAWSGGTEKL